MNWFHAQQYCHDVESGAWLTEIPDDITQSLLYGFMADMPHNEWWVGGVDLLESEFKILNFQILERYVILRHP